jgi:copper(I)-binding protein
VKNPTANIRIAPATAPVSAWITAISTAVGGFWLPLPEIKAGDLVITQAWSRATSKGAKAGAGYLTIENKGSTPDRLIGRRRREGRDSRDGHEQGRDENASA